MKQGHALTSFSSLNFLSLSSRTYNLVVYWTKLRDLSRLWIKFTFLAHFQVFDLFRGSSVETPIARADGQRRFNNMASMASWFRVLVGNVCSRCCKCTQPFLLQRRVFLWLKQEGSRTRKVLRGEYHKKRGRYFRNLNLNRRSCSYMKDNLYDSNLQYWSHICWSSYIRCDPSPWCEGIPAIGSSSIDKRKKFQ